MDKNQKNISLFAVSFRKGFVPPKLPIATFQQGDKEISFLLDSGSNQNVINKEALEYIDHEVIKSDNNHTLSGLNGTVDVTLCSIRFTCDNKEYTSEFLVADLKESIDGIKRDHGITIHGILGAAFFEEHDIVLDFKNLSAYSRK